MEYVSPTNTGVIATSAGDASAIGPRTLIVTGVARSGTSMVSSVLSAAGVYMGEHVYDVVGEDAQVLAILQSGHHSMLKDLIRVRDAAHPLWGFKIPNLHAYLTRDQFAWFRNPRMIAIFRDPVAVAVRSGLSEHLDPINELISTTHAITAVAEFAAMSGCPTLLLSYEKAIMAPERMLESVLSFCGIAQDPALFDTLLQSVMPNNPAYLATANRQYNGFVEGIIDGKVYGWCHQVGSLFPVALELYANGDFVTAFDADQHRGDLASNGIGNGNHGYYLDITRFGFRRDTVLLVKVRNRTVELRGSGRTVGVLMGEVSVDAAPAGGPALAAAR